jgi:hypothetical protein
MILKEENTVKTIAVDLHAEKFKECLQTPEIPCIILLKQNRILRQGKRADSKSGIYVRGRNRCPDKVGNSGPLTKCTDVFPLQARENLLTLLMIDFF